MPAISAFLTSAATLCLYATPSAMARVCWQLALDRHLPKLGFPGLVQGGAAFIGSILLGIIAGLMILEVPKVAHWSNLSAVSISFYAQDVATAAIKAGHQYGKRPGRLLRAIKRLLK